MGIRPEIRFNDAINEIPREGLAPQEDCLKFRDQIQ